MSITVTFDTVENCAAFAASTNLPKVDGTVISVPWEKLSIAKANGGVLSFEQDNDHLVEFIIKGDPTTAELAELIAVKEELGQGFYLIETAHGLLVYDLVDSLDPVLLSSFGLTDVTSLTNVTPGTEVLDPHGSDSQWARIRVASAYRPLQTSFTYYDGLVEKSVSEVYIIDSGVNWEHPEFVNTTGEDFWKIPRLTSFADLQGHGTRVASCVAGENLGIARNAKIRSVKIIEPNFMPTLLDLGDALDAILAQATSNPNVTRIVNVSWLVDENAWLENKFQTLLDAGVTVVAAAGNSGNDIATTTPAGMNDVITVGSIDKFDIPSGFNNIAPSDSGLITNYGLMLDIFAPGEEVVVATAPTGYAKSSGTSYSAGYVSGVAAQIAALFDGSVPNPLLKEKLINVSTKDALLFDTDKFSDNQNRLVYLVGTEDARTAMLDLYIGAFTSEVVDLQVNLETILSNNIFVVLKPDEPFIWSVEFEDSVDSDLYSSFFNIDQESNVLSISKPSIPVPAGETLKMVRFKIISQSDTVRIPSTWLFFFQVSEDLDAEAADYDITRALSETDSTSVFLSNDELK